MYFFLEFRAESVFGEGPLALGSLPAVFLQGPEARGIDLRRFYLESQRGRV